MKIELRLEQENDYRIVEEVTRDAFWNVHIPGCDDHLLIHNLRKKDKFIEALDFVAIYDNKIIGNIVYVDAKIQGNDGNEYKICAFGPVSVLPEYQGKGVGSKIIKHTAKLAKEMGYKAILIYGEPNYYKRFGFIESKEYKITNKDKKYPAALLVWELFPNSLNGIEGIYDEGNIYEVDKEELKIFDKGFPEKEKKTTKSQERFLEMVNKYL
jgi:predicted N-acetyltransferase YhbS